jgi:hypothetical protein
MSDTPRTDKIMKSLDNDSDSTLRYIAIGYEFARQLERELNQAIKERDKARECLREAICYRDSSMSGYDLEEWREAAGENELTNVKKDEKVPIVNREDEQ